MLLVVPTMCGIFKGMVDLLKADMYRNWDWDPLSSHAGHDCFVAMQMVLASVCVNIPAYSATHRRCRYHKGRVGDWVWLDLETVMLLDNVLGMDIKGAQLSVS